jgi:hypothetical protein
MAKQKSSDDPVYEVLKKAADAGAAAAPIKATAALVGAKASAATREAFDKGYLKKQTVETPAKSKKGKPKIEVMVALTTEGVQKIASHESPRAAIEALLPVVQSLARPAAHPHENLEAAFRAASDSCVTAMNKAFDAMRGEILGALSKVNASRPPVDASAALAAIGRALERVIAPSAPSAVAPKSSPSPTNETPLEDEIADDIAKLVEESARKTTVGQSFEVLMGHLKSRHANLTIGAFHDALRRLEHAGRIRLTGWGRMLDDIPEPELALFVSSKVMYYAQPTY